MALTLQRHDRDSAGLMYVYPVISRRSGGLSVGVNLNPNHACNYRCIYCQVPGLVRGKAPRIDVDRLERELDGFLGTVLQGDWLARNAPEGLRRLNDVAFSGNGEPTSAEAFDGIVSRVIEVLRRRRLLGEIELVLITNGSLATQPAVQRGLELMRGARGQVWFKVDAGTDEGLERINDWKGGVTRLERNLRAAAARCPTWIQTCMFALDGEPPSAADRAAYLALLERAVNDEVPLDGVLLYGLARESHQPEAPRLARLPESWLEALATEIRALNLECRVFP